MAFHFGFCYGNIELTSLSIITPEVFNSINLPQTEYNMYFHFIQKSLQRIAEFPYFSRVHRPCVEIRTDESLDSIKLKFPIWLNMNLCQPASQMEYLTFYTYSNYYQRKCIWSKKKQQTSQKHLKMFIIVDIKHPWLQMVMKPLDWIFHFTSTNTFRSHIEHNAIEM